MGRVRDFGSSTTSSRSRRRSTWSAPCSTSRTCTRRATAPSPTSMPFASALEAADEVIEPARRSTSTSATSRTRTATRRSICPTAKARCAPSRCATRSTRFERPATVISESPDEASTQTIGTVLLGESAARRALVDDRFVVAPARAQELGEMPERPVLERAELVELEARRPLRAAAPPPPRRGSARRGRARAPASRRRRETRSSRPDGLARLEREPLGLVDPAPARRAPSRARAVPRTASRGRRCPSACGRRRRAASPRDRDRPARTRAADHHRRARLARRVAELREELARGGVVGLGLDGSLAHELEPALHAQRRRRG